ncbi:MAG: D-alanyl-D-alanine carboxypeptidase [Bacilli bacterium]|nr:D-alanyl-D-alanine carboxypeptidase [Bacilli bacterium]
MKKIIFILLILVLFIPTNIYASSMIGYDMDTKQILYGDNIHETRSVASISKIMTAILACESGKLDNTVIIGDEINKAYGSGIYIRIGEEMTLRDLVYGLMLRSGNDAAFSIAKYVGGTVDNFVAMMNDKAKELGMNDSTFNNPNGLDDKGGNLSSTYDMAILTSYAMKNEDYKTITGTKKHTVKTNMNYYSWTNKNKLLFSYKYTTGGKTGFTKIAKRTLVTTASNNNMNIVIVTLNDGNDFNDHKNLYERLFNEYEGYDILKKGDISIANLKDKNSYYILDNFKYDLREYEKDNIVVDFDINDVKDTNNKIGEVYVYLNKKELYKTDVYVDETKKVTFWQKIKGLFHD